MVGLELRFVDFVYKKCTFATVGYSFNSCE